MSINISIKRKFVVNGEEYGSVEEMPVHIRDAYVKATEGSGAGHISVSRAASTKIVFNGQEYADSAAMPPDVRGMYENVMKSVTGRTGSFRLDTGVQVDGSFRRSTDNPNAVLGRIRPVDPEPLFSARQLLIAAGGAIALLILYIVIRLP